MFRKGLSTAQSTHNPDQTDWLSGWLVWCASIYTSNLLSEGLNRSSQWIMQIKGMWTVFDLLLFPTETGGSWSELLCLTCSSSTSSRCRNGNKLSESTVIGRWGGSGWVRGVGGRSALMWQVVRRIEFGRVSGQDFVSPFSNLYSAHCVGPILISCGCFVWWQLTLTVS